MNTIEIMELKLFAKSSIKFGRSASHSSASWSSSDRNMSKDESLTVQISEKTKNSQKLCSKERTKPQEIKLHTQQRAVKRAIFNSEVATKLYLIEQQKKREERLQKLIEEEEIRQLRKEMIPRAQLMPLFDRPFFPQRSLTIPSEPSLGLMNRKCLSPLTPNYGDLSMKAIYK